MNIYPISEMTHRPILGVLSILNISCNLLLCFFFLSYALSRLKIELRKITININTYPKYLVLYTLTRKQYLSANRASINKIETIIILLDHFIFQNGNSKVDYLSMCFFLLSLVLPIAL